MTARREARFPVDDGVELGAWLYLPKSDAQHCPAITMAHGYAGVKEHGITRFAEAFADAGFVVLLHDHRTFRISGGEPRQDVDPWRQCHLTEAPAHVGRAGRAGVVLIDFSNDRRGA